MATNQQEVTVKIDGVAPLLLHNGRLANPRNIWARAMSVINKIPAKNRTEEDEIERHRLEWSGSMYLIGEKVEDDGGRPVIVAGVPCIPPENWEANIAAGMSVVIKGGKRLSKAAVSVMDPTPIIYSGPKDIGKLWDDEKFSDTRSAKIQRNTIQRCRPRFDQWSATVRVFFNGDMVSKDQIVKAIIEGGNNHGHGDFRPKYGRYQIVEVSE